MAPGPGQAPGPSQRRPSRAGRPGRRGAIAFLVSRDTDAASLAQAQAARQVEVQRCITGQLEGVPTDVPADHRAEFCEQGFIPPVPDRRFHYEHLPEILVGTSGFAIILGWLLGASLAGAEWHAGTMATLLTWEPRRVRVLVAKLVAAGTLVFALTVVLQLLLGAALLTGRDVPRDHQRDRLGLVAVP